MNNNNQAEELSSSYRGWPIFSPVQALSSLCFGRGESAVDPQKIISLCLISFGIFLSMAYLFGHFDINGFTYTHYLFNYENGFIKRGLVGTAFLLSDIVPTKAAANAFAAGLFVLIAFTVTVLLFRPALKFREMSGLWIFGVVAITHNATIQHYLRDFGRFDGLGLILMFVGIIVVERLRQSFALCFVLLIYLFGMMSLVHEANFLAFAPPVIGLYAYIHRDENPLWRVIALLAAATAITFVIARAGVVTEAQMQAMLSKAESQFGDLYDDGFNVLTRDFSENLKITFEALTRSKVALIRNLWLLILTIPLYRLLKPVLKSIMKRGKWAAISLLMSPSALSLHLIGIDHIRWNALAISNCLIFLGALALHDEDIRQQINEICLAKKKLAMGTIMLAIVTGPFGVLSVGW